MQGIDRHCPAPIDTARRTSPDSEIRACYLAGLLSADAPLNRGEVPTGTEARIAYLSGRLYGLEQRAGR